MRNFVILLFAMAIGVSVADHVLADTLYGLYSDNSIKQNNTNTKTTNTKSKSKRRTNSVPANQTYTPTFSNQNRIFKDPNDMMQKGSLNYGQYATSGKRTNPVRFDNPYNHLNDKYTTTQEQVSASTATYDGDAVRFKRGADGNIYGYNKYGKKIGVYRLNNNGTTTQYDTQGNKMGTFK